MRKFTLFIASLFITIGAMAQTVVTTINTDRVYTLKCNSATSDANHGPNQYIGVTDAGIIDGKSAAPAYVTFEAAESGYYIKVGEKYINYNESQSQLTASTEKSTVWVLGTVDNFATFKVTGTTKYLNNNGTETDNTTITNLKANNHTNGPSAGNACFTWEMKEYDLRKVLEYENITAMQEVSADDANTIRGLGNMTVIADVTLTDTNNPALIFAATADYTAASETNGDIWGLGFGGNQFRYIVRSTQGGWYSRSNLSTMTKKIAYTYNYANNTTTITYFADGEKKESVSLNNDVALSSFTGENAKFYIGGVEHTHSNGWYKSFPGTINSLKIYRGVLTDDEVIALTALEDVPVATPEEFVNGKVYTFTTQRGAMGCIETGDNAISTARTTADTETDYFKWTVYESTNGNFYIYNVGKKMFLGEQSTSGNASVPMSDIPAKVTFKTTELAAYPLMFKTTDNANCVINHSPNHGEGLITWNGGWSDLNDTGNAHRVIEVSELDETILNEIAAVVTTYENDNTEAKNNLGAAIANVQALFEAIELGNGLGQYTTSDPQYLEKFQAIVTFYNGITRITSIDEINAKITELDNLVATFSLNLPAAGKYYYLKCNDYYLSNIKENTLTATTEKTVNNIFYFEKEGENTYLLAYENGQYVTNPWNIGIGEDNINENEKYKQTKSFVEGQVGKYAIEYLVDSGDKYYLTVADGVSNATTNKNDNNAQWVLEEVTELPVTVSAAGYATLYAPVALTVPSGVKAYTAVINGEWATLTEVNGVIPANTGVVLEGEGNYSFAIAEDAQSIEGNALRGSVATTYYTEAGTYYALAMVDDVVGFYKDAFNNNRFQNNSHKAYLYVAPEAAANVACYSFRFDGTTGIENVEGQSEGVAIYDLMGRRVENPTRGIYVINGKKVLVK